MLRDPAMVVLIAVVLGLGTAFGWFVAAIFTGGVIGWHAAGTGTYPAVFAAASPVELCGGLLGTTIAICLIVVPSSPRRLAWVAASVVFAEGLVFAVISDRLLALPSQ
jgi:hypothetical protein